jgi:hypothetical protein
MSENLARCRRCHDVFDPDAGACPRCGTPYQSIAAPLTSDVGTYADRYAATAYSDPSLEVPEVVPHANERTTMALVAGGGMLVVALIVALALTLGAIGGSPTTPPIIVSIAPPTSEPPAPTTPPQIAMAIRALSDTRMNGHIVIQARVDQDSLVTGHPSSSFVTLDCQVSNGTELVLLTSGATSEEIRYVDGKYFVRMLPSGKWTSAGVVSSWIAILPLFNLTSDKMLEFVGNESREGVQTYHLRTTNRWAADIGRMGLLDASTLSIKPDTISLDLWTDTFGKPVYASFSAVNLAKDGRKLVDIETTYTFSDVGTAVPVLNPFATPTPVPPSASPTIEG